MNGRDKGRRWAVVGVVGAAVLALVVVVGVLAWPHGTRANQPTSAAARPTTTRPQEQQAPTSIVLPVTGWPSPTHQVAVATTQYLAGEGKALTTLRDTAEQIESRTLTPRTCAPLLTALTEAESPDAMRLLAARIPDDTLAELAQDLTTQVSVTLSGCSLPAGAVRDEQTTLTKVRLLFDERTAEISEAAK